MDKQFWTAAELVERGVYAAGPARPTMAEAVHARVTLGVPVPMGIVRHEHALIPPAAPMHSYIVRVRTVGGRDGEVYRVTAPNTRVARQLARPMARRDHDPGFTMRVENA